MNFLGGGASQAKSRPQYTALQVQTSAYGITISLVFGKTRIAPNLIWYGDFKAIPHSAAGGKGGVMGGGGKSGGGKSYTYQAALALGLCEGPIASVGQIWVSKAIKTLADLGFTLFTGTYPQAAWGYLTTNHAGQDIGYEGLAYVAAAPYNLGNSAQLDQLTFEVTALSPNAIATLPDADPAVVITRLLTDANFGAGFPSAHLDGLSTYSSYCRATGMVVSPAYTDARTAADIITELTTLTNAAPVWTAGILTIVPYGDQNVTANGATYTAPSQAQYDLDVANGDFIADPGSPPIKLTRKRAADAFNALSLEYLNRANQYNTEVVEAKDQAAIERLGLRKQDVQQAHLFCDAAAARQSVQLLLQRQNVLNQFQFTLGWSKILLDPMDIVTLTDPLLGLVKAPVRILEMEENDNGDIAVTAEEYLAGVGATPVYAAPQGTRYSTDYNTAPGNANTPLIFEPPLALTTTGGLEVWAAVSGGINWGGCDVWASSDGASYDKVAHLTASARQGVLTAILGAPASGNPDLTDTLAVDLTQSLGTLLAGSQADVDAFNTLCYVDGEYLAYKNAILTAANKYNLTYLNRGLYGSTAGSHAINSAFARLDDAIAKITLTQDRIGSTIFLKFTGFNVFGGSEQQLSDVAAYTYVITGGGISGALPNPTNLAANFAGGIQQIYWTGITDPRSPIDYEIRRGPAFQSSMVLGRTTGTFFETQGDGTYWVAARFVLPDGSSLYSPSPPSIIIAGSVLVANVIATNDEKATDWPGTVSGGAIIFGTAPGRVIKLGQSSTDILSDPNVLLDADVLGLGAVASFGTYTAPVGHRITTATVGPSQVSMTWLVYAESIHDDILSIANILTDPDVLNLQDISLVSAQPQIRLSRDGGTTFDAWINFTPGTYIFNAIEARMVLGSSDPDITAVLTQWSWSVDVPDRLDKAIAILVGALGMTFVFQNAYPTGNLKPFNAKPLVQVAVLDAQQGDDVVLPDSLITAAQCFFQVVNSGSGVARSVNVTVQGY